MNKQKGTGELTANSNNKSKRVNKLMSKAQGPWFYCSSGGL